MTYDLTYLSLGAGVQSTALMVLSATGRAPKADCAIFADTGDEPDHVYEHLEICKKYCAEHGIDFHVVKKGKISVDTGKHYEFTNVPAFSLDNSGVSGPLRRQCTHEYKIEPINKKVRELLGYKPRQRIKKKARALIGISYEEMQRMKESRIKWITNCYPLVDQVIRRYDCFKIIQEAGIPEPQKSACVFCPYHDDKYWIWLRDNYPKDFEKAVEFDKKIRNLTKAGEERPVFVHRSLKPLDEVTFKADDPNQIRFGFDNECDGMCGV